jgi:hypothetical protein
LRGYHLIVSSGWGGVSSGLIRYHLRGRGIIWIERVSSHCIIWMGRGIIWIDMISSEWGGGIIWIERVSLRGGTSSGSGGIIWFRGYHLA